MAQRRERRRKPAEQSHTRHVGRALPVKAGYRPRMDSSALLVLCTAPAEGEAAVELARGLVASKLAACVNLVPGLRSFYCWKGELLDDREVQLLIKTRAEHFDAVARYIGEHHPYEEPEILALPIAAGSRGYLEWLFAQTSC
jgi:periplasmic divalent cation tolerance protein